MKNDNSLIVESPPKGFLILSMIIGILLPIGILFIMNLISGGALLGYDPIQTTMNFFLFISEFIVPTVDMFYLPLIYLFTGLLMGLVAVRWWKALIACGTMILAIIVAYIGLGTIFYGILPMLFSLLSLSLNFALLLLWMVIPSFIGSAIISSMIDKKSCYSSDLS